MISWSVMSHTSSSDIFLIFSAALFCRALIGDTRTGTWERPTAWVGVVGWPSKSESPPDEIWSNTHQQKRTNNTLQYIVIGRFT